MKRQREERRKGKKEKPHRSRTGRVSGSTKKRRTSGRRNTMKSAFIFSALILLLAPIRVDFRLMPVEAGAQAEMIEEDMTERWKDLIVLRDPFLDPEWLRKQQEEEEKRKAQEKKRRAEEKERREVERKKHALKLKGIVQVGQGFVAIVDGKTLRAGEVIRGRKVLEVNRSGIKVLYREKVSKILWDPQG
jgi:hypothetical protein